MFEYSLINNSNDFGSMFLDDDRLGLRLWGFL